GLDLVTENLLKVTNRLPVVRARDRPPEIYHQRIDFGLICRVIGAAAEQRSLVCQIITHDWLLFLFERLWAASAFANASSCYRFKYRFRTAWPMAARAVKTTTRWPCDIGPNGLVSHGKGRSG